MKPNEYKDKSIEQLKQELLNLFKEQFNLRMQSRVGETKQPHLIKLVRRNIARVKTILSQKEGSKA